MTSRFHLRFWAISTILFIASNSEVSAQPIGPAKSAKIASDLSKLGPGFPFEMTGTNHFYVEVKLNGEGPFRLIFDLGAPVTLLSNRAAKESKTVPPGRRASFLMGMNGEGTVKEMHFGDSMAKNIPVMIFDHPAVTAMSEILGKRFDGILGYTFFARYRTTIDYQKKRLWFEPVKETADNIATALPERMMNPSAKQETREVIPRTQSIGIKVELLKVDQVAAIPPVLKISDVRKSSPAERAGLKTGDILISFGPHWLFSTADLASALSGEASGTSVLAIVKRGAETIQMQVVPEPVH